MSRAHSRSPTSSLFGLIVVVALLLRDPSSQSWLSDHADAGSNVALTIVAFGSLAIGMPFTAPYTALRFEGTDPRLLARSTRVDRHWGIALLIASVVAIYGEWVLDQQTNLDRLDPADGAADRRTQPDPGGSTAGRSPGLRARPNSGRAGPRLP